MNSSLLLSHDVKKLALTYMEGLDCARSLSVAICIRYDDAVALRSLELKADWFLDSDADRYFMWTCATDLLRKYDSPENVDLLEDQAIEKWLWSEHQCLRTNIRLNDLSYNSSSYDGRLSIFLELARKSVLELIGRGPYDLNGRFGPGATVSDKSVRTSVLHKLSSVPSMTPDAWRLLVPWSETKWRPCITGDISIVRGNIFFTVPKTSTSRRSCGKEPSLNVFYQLALGGEMRRCLKKAGLDLDNGQHIHREMARLGSRDGSVATIDLTSASDCVSTSLVRMLMPPCWLKYLEATRSPLTRVKGKWYHLEKYSSMGNGFTFELETAIFAAIVMAVLRMRGEPSRPGADFWVYGDDIIVSRDSCDDVIAALKFAGFTPNPLKTFSKGCFRESCGGDFFNGVPVRAYFLKGDLNEPQDIFAFANGVSRASQEALAGCPDPRFLRVWFRALDLLPSALRLLRGPRDLGDLVIHDSPDRWQIRWRNSIRYIKVYRPAKYRKVKWGWFHPDVQFAAALYGVTLTRPDRVLGPNGPSERSENGAFIVPRDGVVGYKVGWVKYS